LYKQSSPPAKSLLYSHIFIFSVNIKRKPDQTTSLVPTYWNMDIPSSTNTASERLVRAKKANAVRGTTFARSRAGNALRTMATSSGLGSIITKAFQGDLPLLNEDFIIVHDPDGHHVYLIGGFRRFDENYIPTSDLYRFDTQDKVFQWTNLTVGFSLNHTYTLLLNSFK